ncbi:MAG: hypothetical protein IJV30_10460, partial [Oscillospiraceae bacterium]|nr:hypothetical protein [Oscillospiraceae bacterium]
WLLGFVWLGNLTIHHSKQNLLHFYFFGISCWLIAIASAIWYNKLLNFSGVTGDYSDSRFRERNAYEKWKKT